MPVCIRIQHVAGRDGPLARLRENLPPEVEVVTDSGEGANPWRGYQRCLSDLPHEGHVLVLQDDTIVCRNFVAAVELIAEANPDEIVCLYTGGNPRRTASNVKQAMLAGFNYAMLSWHDFLPVVATMWPVQLATEFMQWVEPNRQRLPGGLAARSDDAVAGRWLRFTRHRVRVTVPSLVEHPDDVPSTIRRQNRGGKDSGRVAVYYIGDGDPLAIDWTNPGLLTPGRMQR